MSEGSVTFVTSQRGNVVATHVWTWEIITRRIKESQNFSINCLFDEDFLPVGGNRRETARSLQSHWYFYPNDNSILQFDKAVGFLPQSKTLWVWLTGDTKLSKVYPACRSTIAGKGSNGWTMAWPSRKSCFSWRFIQLTKNSSCQVVAGANTVWLHTIIIIVWHATQYIFLSNVNNTWHLRSF